MPDPYCEHRQFLDQFAIRHVFNHHDPREDQTYNYYGRKVARLRRVFNSSLIKAFFLIKVRTADDEAACISLYASLIKRTHSFTLFYVSVADPDRELIRPAIKLRHLTPGLRMYDFTPTSQLGSLSFENPVDELWIAALAHEFTYNLRSDPSTVKTPGADF